MNFPKWVGLPTLTWLLFASADAQPKPGSAASPGKLAQNQPDYCRILEPLSASLASSLSRAKEVPVTLAAFSQDARYGLPLEAFWGLQQDCLRRKGHAEVTIKAQAFPAPGPMRAYLRQAKGKSGADARWRLETHNLAGDILIDRLPSYRIGLRVELLDAQANVLWEDTLPDLSALASHHGISATLFSRLKGDSALDQSEFHQKAVDRIQTALFARNTSGILPGQSFALRNHNGQINQAQLAGLKQVLVSHFGFALDEDAKQAVRLDPFGGLVFHRVNIMVTVDSIVDPQPFLDARAWEPDKVLTLVDTALASGPDRMPLIKRMRFADASDRFPSLGQIIQREIDTVLPAAYGGADGRLDTTYLRRVFKGGEKSIQIGKWANPEARPRDAEISGPKAYSESVYYYRISPKDYVDGLARKHAAGDRFDVRLSLLRLYREGRDGKRYWGVVYQTWKTRDARGHPKYWDDGLLLVNFDFKPDASGKFRLDDFKVYYRFFFHRYRTSVFRKGPEGNAEEIKPSQRVLMDIAASFFKSSEIPPKTMFGELKGGRFEAAPEARTLVGVNHGILKVIHRDIAEVLP